MAKGVKSRDGIFLSREKCNCSPFSASSFFFPTRSNLVRLPLSFWSVSCGVTCQARRMALPVNGMEQEIVEAIVAGPEFNPLTGASLASTGGEGPALTADGLLADVVVLCGETGSGKSTQVPTSPAAYFSTESLTSCSENAVHSMQFFCCRGAHPTTAKLLLSSTQTLPTSKTTEPEPP